MVNVCFFFRFRLLVNYVLSSLPTFLDLKFFSETSFLFFFPSQKTTPRVPFFWRNVSRILPFVPCFLVTPYFWLFACGPPLLLVRNADNFWSPPFRHACEADPFCLPVFQFVFVFSSLPLGVFYKSSYRATSVSGYTIFSLFFVLGSSKKAVFSSLIPLGFPQDPFSLWRLFPPTTALKVFSFPRVLTCWFSYHSAPTFLYSSPPCFVDLPICGLPGLPQDTVLSLNCPQTCLSDPCFKVALFLAPACVYAAFLHSTHGPFWSKNFSNSPKFSCFP